MKLTTLKAPTGGDEGRQVLPGFSPTLLGVGEDH